MRNLEATKVKKGGSEKKKGNRDTYNISPISKECCVCKVVFR